MKCLVTGGCGFIGSNLVDRLIEDGHQVVVIDNESSDAHDNFYYNDSAEYWDFDISNLTRIEPLFKDVDWVFHMAAECRIQNTIENPMLAVRTNVMGTCNVLQACRTHGVKRVVYSSTSSAYGLANEAPHYEHMTPDLINPYAATKIAGEDLCKVYYKMYDLDVVILRYFNVYGERQPKKGAYAPVIGIFSRQMSESKPITIVGDGKQERDYVFVGDVVNANIMAAETDNENAIGETMNVGTGVVYSVNDIADMIGAEDIEYLHARSGEARKTQAVNYKISSMLGWYPTTDLKNWLDRNF